MSTTCCGSLRKSSTSCSADPAMRRQVGIPRLKGIRGTVSRIGQTRSMPRSIWKGAISFGLVTIPVKLFSATEEKDISFRQVHPEDGGRIKYKRVCEIDGKEIPYTEIAKGYEMPDGRMVILEAEDFESLPLPGVTHMYTSDPVVMERLWAKTATFFKSHLGEPK